MHVLAMLNAFFWDCVLCQLYYSKTASQKPILEGRFGGMGITIKLIVRYLSMYLTKVSKMKKKHVGKGIWHLHSVLTDVQNVSHFGQLFVSFL